MPFHPPAIRDEGLEFFLDASKSKHNGFGYKEFVTFYKVNLNNASIAKTMNIKRTETIKKWIAIYLEEQSKEGTI